MQSATGPQKADNHKASPSYWIRMYRDSVYAHFLLGPVTAIYWYLLHLIECIQPIYDLAKYGVLPIEVRMSLVTYKELAAIRVGAAICHGHNPPLGVLQLVIDFIWEFTIGRVVD
jgi:hypothetical protein